MIFLRLPKASLLSVCLLASALPCFAQETPPASKPTAAKEEARTTSEIIDEARVFSTGAKEKAQQAIEKIERERKVPVIIATIETLGGEPIDAVALRRARQSGRQGVFILIARKDAKIEVLVSRAFSTVLPKERSLAVRDAMIEQFRKKEFDEGLVQGVRELDSALAKAASEGRSAPPGLEGGSGPLVLRDQVHLTLAGARLAHAAAERKAAEMGWKMNIAVVDDGGHLITFTRMEGARPASVATAITKATSAATYRQATGPLPAGAATPDVLLNLSLQNAAAVGGGKITTLFGGIPIVVDGKVIGAVGVGGGTGEQDAEVAKAGANAVMEAVRGRDHEPAK